VYSFDYLAPDSMELAQRALQDFPDAKLLAGGMSLLSAMKLRLSRPSHLIDLRKVAELTGICREKGELVIGAMTRHADVAASLVVMQAIPALAALAGSIGDRQVRNRGTLGGSIANCDPAACYPAAVMSLGASLVTNLRTIYAEDFFVGLFETALGPHEILREVRFPLPQKAAYVKYVQPASRFAIVGVMAAQRSDGQICIGVTGAKARAYRERTIEEILARKVDPREVRAAQLDVTGYNDDIHADAVYRRHLVSEIAARAIEQLCATTSDHDIEN
jgi:carbon-monoxide dehydrogenase medium subunit